MREILFRGKRYDNNEWIKGGFYLEPYTDNAYIVAWNSMGMGFIEYILVYKETVGQYTGLKDRNGVRIFEGDIIKATYRGNYGRYAFEVVFDEGRFALRENGVVVEMNDGYRPEVIGNIQDNPELIAEVSK